MRQLSPHVIEALERKLQVAMLKRIADRGKGGLSGQMTIEVAKAAQALRKSGLVEFYHGRWYITDAGIVAADALKAGVDHE